ncbi:MAG: hypothetical protein COA73_04165 [Candidatus Hydrogenedentota bacterium]|nr:MAG: hypothetical protein COA73_04165 [Candidatus Hydrogenedentota bacterium]
MDKERFSKVISDLYAVIHELEDMFPGRPFTPDGHLVGSIGESLVAVAYGLVLMAPSNKGYDATDSRGRKIEIKATQSKQVGFRSEPDYCIVIKLQKDGSFVEVYNGPGSLIWNEFDGKVVPSNGQFQISLSKLTTLQKLVPENEIIPRIS